MEHGLALAPVCMITVAAADKMKIGMSTVHNARIVKEAFRSLPQDRRQCISK